MLPTIERAGFTAFDTGGASLRDDADRLPLLRLDMHREYQIVREGFPGNIARPRAVAIVTLASAWRPDLLVCDELDFGCMVEVRFAGALLPLGRRGSTRRRPLRDPRRRES
jgi:hypothetical protein